MDEEACEGRKVERPPRTQRTGKGRERADKGPQRLGGAVRERALGLDVEDTDDGSPGAKRDRELRDHPGQRLDVVRVGSNVRRELRAAEPDRAPDDAALDREAVRDDRIPALRDQPESSVLEHEDRRHGACDRLVERFDGRLDRLLRLVVRTCFVGRALSGSCEKADVDRPKHTRSRRGTLHALVIGLGASPLHPSRRD